MLMIKHLLKRADRNNRNFGQNKLLLQPFRDNFQNLRKPQPTLGTRK